MQGVWLKKCARCGNYIKKTDPEESVMVLRLRVAGTRQPLFLRVHQELLRPGGKNMRSAAATGPFIPAHRERSAPRLPPDLLT